ncbi:DHHC palmitoyltransferase-domain-containing protein [Lipomyces kononenkoae]|uniref:DHHC palmitoyltransferase-domain-containing protein n=1 Tax=Lipomyces kononenkoae TaxID=34357 RepID=A0ACC3TBN1_LIPKO
MPESTEEHEPGQRGVGQYLAVDSSSTRLRKYSIFPITAIFYLKRYVQSSGKRPYSILVFAAIAVPTGLFFGFTAPWIWYNVSHSLPVIFAYVLLLCVISLCRSAGSDPGILPRNIHIETSESEKREPGSLNIAPLSVTVNCRQYDEDHPVYLRINYCSVCRIWRPARSIHCRECDSCIDFMDHHCIWLNNCIGVRNYRYFFCFILSLSLLGYFMTSLCFLHVFTWKRQKSSTTIAALRFAPVSFALAIYGILGSIYPTALSLYHIFLMSRGEKTAEFLRSRRVSKLERRRPYDTRNIQRNILYVLCAPRRISYTRSGGMVVPRDC